MHFAAERAISRLVIFSHSAEDGASIGKSWVFKKLEEFSIVLACCLLVAASMQTATPLSEATGAGRADERGLRILAKTVYREMKASGHSKSEIVGFTNALLEMLTTDARANGG